jgi:hypothetical protein
MFGDVAETVAMLPAVDVSTALLAKSQGDELLEEIFLNFPLAIVGAVFGYAAVQTAKGVLEVEIPEGSEGVVLLVAAVGGAGAFILLTKVGVLGGISGILAKTLLDVWNVIANLVLKGAILKY